MQFQNLPPSPALSIVQFSDIDAFRPIEFVADARSVPLNLANFHTARAMVNITAKAADKQQDGSQPAWWWCDLRVHDEPR